MKIEQLIAQIAEVQRKLDELDQIRRELKDAAFWRGCEECYESDTASQMFAKLQAGKVSDQ